MDGQDPPTPASPSLALLPYHEELIAYLRQHARSAWSQYASAQASDAVAEEQRLYLLKNTVVLGRENHAELYALVDEVARAVLGDVPVELYQGEDTGRMNAGLLYLPNVARVVLHGPIQERLSEAELKALLAHELAHHRIWTVQDGACWTAARVLDGIESMSALRSVENARRRLSLFTELLADRVALQVAGLEATLGCLLKTRTGLGEAQPLEFLDQCRELAALDDQGSKEPTHPEAHMRALALDWHQARGGEAEGDIRRLVEGPLELEELDLLQRGALEAYTEWLVGELLQPDWFRTLAVVGQARQMFDGFEVAARDESGVPAIGPWGKSVRHYLAYVLTDFTATDPELAPLPFLRCHAVAEELGLVQEFERAVNRELRMTKKSIRELLETRDASLSAAEAKGGEA